MIFLKIMYGFLFLGSSVFVWFRVFSELQGNHIFFRMSRFFEYHDFLELPDDFQDDPDDFSGGLNDTDVRFRSRKNSGCFPRS